MDALYSGGVRLSSHYVHLMCSPSRTQFLTGRYAMNLGFGEFFPWNNLEIGGIPIGQPTVANWLSAFGQYTTYGVGKWHLGYANPQLTPRAKGFHHFFGFYQGAIDYESKVYNDIEHGAEAVYDFFDDEEAAYFVIESEQNTMELYSERIRSYLDAEGRKLKAAERTKGVAPPFFLLAALQSMHSPFPVLREYAAECAERVSVAAPSQSAEYKEWRQLYCELTLTTDRVIGEIVAALRENRLFENTLIVLTADNGGETDNGASNYPFRGTKGEFYEGNTRVIASISGGIVEREGLGGQSRDELFSNLDWTPTLLHFAGYSQCIEPKDRSWDGVDQHALIMGRAADGDSRRSLVLNIGDAQLRSARVIVEHAGHRYKYLKSDNSSALDRWVYSGRLSDVWTEPDYGFAAEGEGGVQLPALRVLEFDADDDALRFSQHFGGRFLFDLTADPAERRNLLQPEVAGFDAARNDELVALCEEVLARWMEDNVEELFSPPIDFLHQRLKEGDPKLLGDGKFVRSFLSDHQYQQYITAMFDEEQNYIPQKLQDLYLTPWTFPGDKGLSGHLLAESASVSEIGHSLNERRISVAVPLAFGLCVVAMEVFAIGLCRVRTNRVPIGRGVEREDVFSRIGCGGEYGALLLSA